MTNKDQIGKQMNCTRRIKAESWTTFKCSFIELCYRN